MFNLTILIINGKEGPQYKIFLIFHHFLYFSGRHCSWCPPVKWPHPTFSYGKGPSFTSI